ncbi:MAG: Crp/Fnr family transcriptional regulator [Mariprofundaceae bacterium]
MQTTRLELLQGMPVFGGIREKTLEFLLELASITDIAANDYFFREGDKGSSMFVLEQGKVAILKNWDDQEHALKYLGRGDCFGEMALIDLYPRSASVRAVEDCTAIELTNTILLELYRENLEQFTMVQMNIGREISRRLRKADNRLFHAHVEEKHLSVDDLFELF